MDKIDLLLDAIEHPDRYSAQEIDSLLSDPEVREAYELLHKAKTSLTPIAHVDVHAEWDAFSRAHKKPGFRILNLFSHNVAATVAIGIASLAAVAAVVSISVDHSFFDNGKTAIVESPKTERIYSASAGASAAPLQETAPEKAPEIIVFENETLETIISSIADFYGYEASFSSASAKPLRLYFRWDQSQTIEKVAESLNNFEQIHLTLKDTTINID